MGLKTWEYGAEPNILAFPNQKVAIGVQVNDTGVTADGNGRKIIPAGSPVGGDADAKADETAVLSVNESAPQGVLQHDVDVTSGQANGTMIIWGFINEYRLPKGLTISDATKTALDGKVEFLKRNDLP